MHVGFSESIGLQSQLLCLGTYVALRNLSALPHHIAKLSGQGQSTFSFHPRCLDKQDVPPGRGHTESRSNACDLDGFGGFGFKSGREVDKFDGVNYKTGTTGAPIVTDNSVAWYEAKVKNEVDVGTHTIFIGEVVDADVLSEEPPMTYAHYHEVKRGTTPKTAPSYIKKEDEK